MNILKKYIYSFSYLLVLSSSPFLKASNQKEDEVVVKVHNIGQGNFVTLKVKEATKKKPSYMLIDVGTASYMNEILYNELQTPVKIKTTDLADPSSTVKTGYYKDIVSKGRGDKEKNNKEAQAKKNQARIEADEYKKEMSENMRKMLGMKKNADPIHLKTIIITHPDVDPYNWLFEIFNHPEDKIDYLIFGGLPQVYVSKKVDNLNKFTPWIENRINQKSKIFFPAIQYDPIDSLEQVLTAQAKELYGHHSFTPVKGDWPTETIGKLKEAVNFGENVKISFLSINPTHFLDDNNEVIRMSFASDTNPDSLVLKVAYGESSIILTGDATGITFTRIKSNYKNCLEYLYTKSYLVPHHGSDAEEANDSKWLNLFNPNTILISNGHNKSHPSAQAYESFKNLASLKTVTRHNVLVGKSNNFKQGSLHETSRAIFSTLNSGTLTVTLHQDGKFNLFTAKDKHIKIYNKKDFLEDFTEEVQIQEEEGKVVLSPVKISRVKKTKSKKTLKEKVSPINYELETPVVSPNLKKKKNISEKISEEETSEKKDKKVKTNQKSSSKSIEKEPTEKKKSDSNSSKKKNSKKTKKRKPSESPDKPDAKRTKNNQDE